MMNYDETCRQIGRGVIMSVSGGRIENTADKNVLRFPVSHGYAVEVAAVYLDRARLEE